MDIGYSLASNKLLTSHAPPAITEVSSSHETITVKAWLFLLHYGQLLFHAHLDWYFQIALVTAPFLMHGYSCSATNKLPQLADFAGIFHIPSLQLQPSSLKNVSPTPGGSRPRPCPRSPPGHPRAPPVPASRPPEAREGHVDRRRTRPPCTGHHSVRESARAPAPAQPVVPTMWPDAPPQKRACISRA